jgi:hypothetical protein
VDDNGTPIPNQFVLPLGGLGSNGPLNAAGFYLDSMSLQTAEGTTVQFTHAPVLVVDITVQDPATQQALTLDGDFGMNYLVASINLDASGLGGNSSASPWDWVTFDQPHGVLGLEPASGTTTTDMPAVAQANFDYTQFPEELSFAFNTDVTATPDWASVLKLQNLTTGQTITPTSAKYDNTTGIVTYALDTPIPDGNYRATLLASGITDANTNHLDGNADGTPGDNYTYDFFQLAGDANHDGKVNLTDFGAFRGHFGKQTDATWDMGDFNYDGAVNLQDFGILRANFGKSLPAVTTAAAPAAAAQMQSSTAVAPAGSGSADVAGMHSISTSAAPAPTTPMSASKAVRRVSLPRQVLQQPQSDVLAVSRDPHAPRPVFAAAPIAHVSDLFPSDAANASAAIPTAQRRSRRPAPREDNQSLLDSAS